MSPHRGNPSIGVAMEGEGLGTGMQLFLTKRFMICICLVVSLVGWLVGSTFVMAKTWAPGGNFEIGVGKLRGDILPFRMLKLTKNDLLELLQ